jgi:DtxR family Mn-dependent transcriptional regulator
MTGNIVVESHKKHMLQEDYLETIYTLSQNLKTVRISDIAKELRLRKPSVTQMMTRLEKKGLVRHHPYLPIELTSAGRRIGKNVAERHRILHEFFTYLRISRGIEEKDIHGIEHCISPVTLKKLKKVNSFLKDNKFRG